MKTGGLKSLLATLSVEEQAELVLAYINFMNQQVLAEAASGRFVPKYGDLEPFLSIHQSTLDRVAWDVATNDRRGGLRTTIADFFRILKPMQREPTGPMVNTWFRAHLSDRVFRSLYDTAGLDVETLVYDPDFPTGPVDVARVYRP